MQDIPKLYTALAEWSACLIYVLSIGKRYAPAVTAALMSGFLILFGFLHMYIGTLENIAWVLGMAAAMCIMYLCILLCCRIRPKDAVLCWGTAFLEAEFVAAFEWQISAFLIGGVLDPSVIPQKAYPLGSTLFENLFMLGFYLISGIAFLALERKLLADGPDYHMGTAEMVSCIVIPIAFFFLSNVSYSFPNTPFSASAASQMFYIRTLVDFSGLLILITQQTRLKENVLRAELANTNLLMQKQFEQYQFSKSSIDRLNRQYHDMKYQIDAIRAETDSDKREGYLKELESGLEAYDSAYKTGNAVLDTVLTGKSMQCVQAGIQFSCVADGKLLDFMDVMDLCSIFGNALDNAIEGSRKVAERSHRIIRTAVYEQGGFVVIRFENYYEQPLEMQEEGGNLQPVTTKEDRESHGYGIKSIRMAARRYDGTVTIMTEDHWFFLRILIPEPAR